MSESHAHKRQRVSKACEQCRRKKRGPPKGYIEAIEGRLHRLESLLSSNLREEDPLSQAILAELNAPLETAYGELVRPRPARQDEPVGYKEDEREEKHLSSYGHPSMHLNLPSPSSIITTYNKSPNDNLGNVSIDENGQLRYYGKSSGYYMLKKSKNFQNGAFHFNSRGYIAKARNYTSLDEKGPLKADPFEIPPVDLSRHLLDLYFAHFYPLLPLLHKKSFLQSLEKSDDQKPPLLLMNSIYAVASRISPDLRVRTDPSLQDTAGDMFFERARLLLEFEWDNFKVSTIQSLLLLSSHQNGALKNIRGWVYSGLAFRMAQNLGLNRNCSDWGLSASEKEERKRLFYCCFVLDRLTCGMHGRSPMLDERDYDTPYPTEPDPDETDRSPHIIENFHQLIKLCEVLGAVLRDLYTVKGRHQLSTMSSPDSVISVLDKRLNAWVDQLPSACQYRPPNSCLNEKAPAPALELCQLHMLFYTTLILLHRPFIPGPTQSASASTFPSASICSFAANKILDIVESLMAEGRLKNINNYSLYFMFTAGIIFINDASSNDSVFSFEAKISINKIIHAMDVIEATWITSARHCNILGELAGLRDINLEAVEEGYVRPAEKKVVAPLSINVPNSPVTPLMETEDIRQSVDSSGQDTTGVRPSYPVSSQFECTQLPPLYFTDPVDAQNRPYDPVGTAFWGVPASFDIDEWSQYFSHQNQQPQRQEPSASLNSQSANGSYFRSDRHEMRPMW
ncbi:fungal-specific transcription factor domain-containing protein [Spinellus fusiger]|nr:fungal-specific transcription factor domain-containing protein [Spinellus fusiger]